MNELFKEIIIGEKDLKELDNAVTSTSRKARHLNDIAKYFLKTTRRKYKDEKINNKDIKKLLYVYNDLINENRTVKKYINAREDSDELLKDAEHIMKLFIDDYISSKRNNSNKLYVNITVSGYVEPLLLTLVVMGISVIFLCNLYLAI